MTATCRPWLPARATTRRRGAAVARRAGPAARTRATKGASANAAAAVAAMRRPPEKPAEQPEIRAEAPVADIAEERRARKDAIKSDNAGRGATSDNTRTDRPARPARDDRSDRPRRDDKRPPSRRRHERRHGRFRRRHARLHADRRQGLIFRNSPDTKKARLRAFSFSTELLPSFRVRCAARKVHRLEPEGVLQVSGESWISTRRLCARPSAVAFVAIGRVGPKPVTAKRRESTPCWLR